MPSQRYERVPSVVVEDTGLGETNPPRYDDLPDKPCDAPSPFSKYTSDDPTGLDLNLSLDIAHVTRNATVERVLADRVVQLEVKLAGRNAENKSIDTDIESITWSKWKKALASDRIIAVTICLMVILSLAMFFGGIAWAIYNVVRGEVGGG